MSLSNRIVAGSVVLEKNERLIVLQLEDLQRATVRNLDTGRIRNAISDGKRFFMLPIKKREANHWLAQALLRPEPAPLTQYRLAMLQNPRLSKLSVGIEQKDGRIRLTGIALGHAIDFLETVEELERRSGQYHDVLRRSSQTTGDLEALLAGEATPSLIALYHHYTAYRYAQHHADLSAILSPAWVRDADEDNQSDLPVWLNG